MPPLFGSGYVFNHAMPAPTARRLIVQLSGLAGDKEVEQKKGDSSFQCFDTWTFYTNAR